MKRDAAYVLAFTPCGEDNEMYLVIDEDTPDQDEYISFTDDPTKAYWFDTKGGAQRWGDILAEDCPNGECTYYVMEMN